MEELDLARWQFGITTVYHFIFVPLTIGLSTLVAIMQTIWYRTKKDSWLRVTKFFGKLLLINFAIGVVTGIVQEFQFGMNWSEYSRFVGDVFGAPLAMEALAAFFIESTFLGLWIFGWDKLSKRVHLACIWAVAFSTTLSAYFILAANSFMQHPVGAEWNEELGRAQLVDIGAVLTNPTTLVTFPHVVVAAWLVGATFVTAVCAIWIVKCVRAGDETTARTVYRPAALLGIVGILVAGVGLLATGDAQAKIMYEQQPGKMSAAEAHFDTSECVGFSLLAIGDLNDPNNPDGVRHLLEIPCGTSFLATGNFTGPDSVVPGTNDVQAMFEERFADTYGDEISYIPNLMVTYWSFRLMIGPAVFSAALALWGLWLLRKGRVTDNPWFARLAVISIPMPFLANSFGWIFTEMGRQPWVVVPNIGPDGVLEIEMLTATGVSPAEVVSPGLVLTSMIAFTLVYGVLAVIWFRLMRSDVRKGAIETDHPHDAPSTDDDDGTRKLDFAY